MPSIEQHVKELTDEVRGLIHILKHNGAQMVDAVADLTRSVNDAIDEIGVLLAGLKAIPPDNTAAVEAQIARLDAVVAAAKAPVAPVVDVPPPNPAT